MPEDKETPYTVLLAHAVRFWQLGEENARRYAIRVNLLSTAVVALMGLAFAKIGFSPEQVSPSWMSSAIRSFMVVAVAFLLMSFLYLLGFIRHGLQWGWVRGLKAWLKKIRDPEGGGKTPTDIFLAIAPLMEGVPIPEAGTAESVREKAFLATFDAASILSVRNALEKRRVDAAQQWFLFGLFFLGVALACYTFAARLSPTQAPAGAIKNTIVLAPKEGTSHVTEPKEEQPSQEGGSPEAAPKPEAPNEGKPR